MQLKHFRPGGSFSKLKITNGMDTIKDNYSPRDEAFMTLFIYISTGIEKQQKLT